MELTRINTYQEFKEAFGNEVRKQSEGFVRIGYLLKRARDTDILADSGYKTIAEFAWAEYHFTGDVVSKMIGINDRYSVDGYSDRLQEKYRVYGMSLLAEMLTLPEEVVDLLPAGTTRQEIRQIKAEIKEEEKITDLEVLMEGEKPEQKMMESKLERFFHQYYYDNRIQYEGVYESLREGTDKINQVFETLAPSGIATLITRIQGLGKYMLSIKGKESELELLNIRDNSKDTFSWEECIAVLTMLCPDGGKPEKAWEALYGEPLSETVQEVPAPAPKPEPKKEPESKLEIAPAQTHTPAPDERDEGHIHDKEPDEPQEPEICLHDPDERCGENRKPPHDCKRACCWDCPGREECPDECCISECRPQEEEADQEPEQPEFAPAQPEPEAAVPKEPEVIKQMDVEDYEEMLPEGYIKCHDGSQVSEERIRTRYEAMAAAKSIVEMAEILNQADDRDWYLWLEERDERDISWKRKA
nr:MAG TPA: hypothetical protein [Caudoviricetes sp.]